MGTTHVAQELGLAACQKGLSTALGELGKDSDER